MASPLAPDEHFNAKSDDEGTTAFHKKRSRRVSFAENTSVHIFDRDDEYETPPDSVPRSPPSGGSDSTEHDNDPKQFFRNEEDEDEPGSRSPFLRLVASPSSGGSTIGSATSNDEDNFFGPVSASFIRRDLSDSAASDDNYDLTMDSTAFSMHFQSIARSDSEGDLKTSTGVHLSFEDKTPTQGSTPAKTGNSMLLTLAKKPAASTSKLSTGSESNDMSLVGEYNYKYDYGKLSPTLNALLAEGTKDSPVISTSNISILKSPIKAEKQYLATKENGPDLMDCGYAQDSKLEVISSREMLNEVVYLKHNQFSEANNGSRYTPNKQIVVAVSSNTSDSQGIKHLTPNQSVMDNPIPESKEHVKDASELKSSLDFWATSQSTPSNPKNMVYKLDDVTGKENKFPLIGSMTYLTDKPSHILLDGASPSKSPWTTPSHDQVSVSLRSLQHGGNVSSIQKSISKLRILEASPFSADLNAKLADSNSRSLARLSKMTTFSSFLEKNQKSPQVNYINDAGTETLKTYLEEQLPSAAQRKRERVLTNMDDAKIETPKNAVSVTHMENSSVKVALPLALPFDTTSSGEKMQPDPLTTAETGYGRECCENKFDYSPQKKLKMVKIGEFKGSSLRDGTQSIQCNEPVKFGPGHISGPGENVTNTSLFTTASDRIGSLYIERRDISTPLNITVSTDEEMVDKRKVLHDINCNLETRDNYGTLSKEKEHENFQFNITESNIPMGRMETDSLVFHGTVDKQSCPKNLEDQVCLTPSNEDLYNVSHNDNIKSLPEEDVVSPSANELSNGGVRSAGRKRKTEDGMIDKIAKTKRSPNLTKGCHEQSSDSGISRTYFNVEETHTRFSEETKQLLPQSVNEINLHAIDHLVDIVGQLQRSKAYGLLSTEIQSQKILDPGSSILHKRASETKLLLCKIVHEQAKLQLMRVKRERLLKSAQSLTSGIQKSEVLGLNYSPQHLDVQIAHLQSDNMKDVEEYQIDRDKVTSMGQTLENINRRISNLTKSIHKLGKMKVESSSADTIAFVHKHLMKRTCCQIVRKDLQLWVVDSLESGNGHHNVVLNYLDLIIQRLTLSTGLVPGISISNKLNDINISKNFKDMDACTAFRFVFDADITQKHVGAASLAQETQMSSSLLGNLVDVLEEIQLARIELSNLLYTRFRTPLADHLEVELYFFDARHHKKAAVTLNMSCLKRGIYPAEIIPCQIDIPIDDPLSSSYSSLSADTNAAITDIKVGYSRIQGLCKCISQLISPSSG